jgi:hypothetical protein
VSTAVPGTLEEVAKYDHGYNFRFHGSYAFVGQINGESHFFTTDTDTLVAYTLVEGKEGARGKKAAAEIIPMGRLALPVWTNPGGKSFFPFLPPSLSPFLPP